MRIVRLRLGVVYYPLWVIRYQFRGRTFQVVVDGNSDKVLYGKAPGNTFYRAGVLVGGMAAGSFITIDVPALVISFSNGSSHNNNSGAFIIGAIVGGLGIMYAAFRAFRYGEEYEFRSGPKPASAFISGDAENALKQVGNVISILEKFQ